MTERDYWSERLQCPRCGATGNAVLFQAKPDTDAYHSGRDQNVRAELVPSLFRIEVTDLGCQFFCASCGTLADHQA